MATTGEALKHAFGNSILAQLVTKYDDPTAPNSRSQINLAGTTYVVTGANSGLGLALCIHLANLGVAHLIMAVRNLQKGEEAKQKVLEEVASREATTGGKKKFDGRIDIWELDMASFASCAAFAKRIRESGEIKRLDGVALNAGVSTHGWSLTKDGWETTFQVNSLSTALLGVLVLPALQYTTSLPPPNNNPGKVPIVPHLCITGSGGQNVAKFVERLAPGSILAEMNDESKFQSFDRYPTSKLFNYMSAQKICKLRSAQGVIVDVVDPGMNFSDLSRDAKIPAIGRGLIQLLAWPAAKGALNVLYGLIEYGVGPSGVGDGIGKEGDKGCGIKGEKGNEVSGGYISRTRSMVTPGWLSTPEGQAIQDKVWKEMVDVWIKALPGSGIESMLA